MTDSQPGVRTDTETADLVDGFDALLFDLDGVVYVGPDAVPNAVESIAAARLRGVSCVFVTNNAARPAHAVAAHLTAIGVPCQDVDVVTSPQAAVSLLPRYVPDGARILVVGGVGIDEALSERGYRPVRHLDDAPAAVMQGYSPDLSWRDLAEATFAVRSGLPWISTNPDLTFPTPRGVAPGNGSLVKAVAHAVGRDPDAVAGKPEPPLLLEAIARVAAQRPLMIGDRLDTDIAAGPRAGVPTLLVMTGVTSFAEVLAAIPEERPDYLGADLRVLVEPYPQVHCGDGRATCGAASAAESDGRLMLVGTSAQDPWDGLRAAAAVAWQCADREVTIDVSGALLELGGMAP